MDPIALSEEVEKRYRRFLETTFFFKDPGLRAAFSKALETGRLSKGPYLEATPVFMQGQTPRCLFEELLGRPVEAGFLKALHGDRPLYQHQEAAIRAAAAGHNVLVATGTGSGKTEAFLYPILLRLLQEHLAGTLDAGVRALVLYPMNALANDQRERLGEIASALAASGSTFTFTFGQYTGETPEDERDSRRQANDRRANRLPGELVLRDEMRNTPPHILLTNYSMLEYLLLRPDDSPLFDHGRAATWTFLVLDEAHQYRGFRGIEMAMLLRRLKRRLRDGGQSHPFTCIATSASLAGGDQDRAAVAAFATNLFGEPFRTEHIILGRTVSLPPLPDRSLAPAHYEALERALDDGGAATQERLTAVAEAVGVVVDPGDDVATAVGRILQADRHSALLRQRIVSAPEEVQALSNDIFPDEPQAKRLELLVRLVGLLTRAQEPAIGTPLLSARYHLFLRSLEGAFVTYWPEKCVLLDRTGVGGDRVAFEVAVCRECGQHYFVGPKDFSGGRLSEATRDPADPEFGATFFRPLDKGETSEADDDEADDDLPPQVFQLCVRCGEMARDQPRCGHPNLIRVLREKPPKDPDRADQQARCSACGYTAAGRDPVREVVYGSDGPNAVVATALYQKLPPARRKVLAFADGRQEAAYFAWYLGRSYEDLFNRHLVLQAARQLAPHAPDGLTLAELAPALRGLLRKYRLLPAAAGDLELLREAWRGLYREFLTDERRIALEGVGLIQWLLHWPDWLEVPEALLTPPWSLGDDEARALVAGLLDQMRLDRAVALRTSPGVELSWDDLRLTARPIRYRIGRAGQADIRSWDGITRADKPGRTQRTLYLARLLGDRSPGSNTIALASGVLRAIWEQFQRAEARVRQQDRLLVAVDDTRQLNPDWWRLRCLVPKDVVYQCDTCSRLQPRSIRGICPRRGCPGTLREIHAGDLPLNHYRLMYEEDWPGLLRVEEHTAQLSNEQARAYQQEFKQGLIHVLSCSTTFELGVDLGDLDTIFLRNVPPEAFNYAQRVGRAGRRRGYPGFAITFCRRTPHDLYHFGNPAQIISGRVRPPTVQISNAKIIGRHITATALSAFFRAKPDRFATVKTMLSDFNQPLATCDVKRFLSERQSELEAALDAIVPADEGLRRELGLHDGSWVSVVAGPDSRLALAEAEVASDYRAVEEFEHEARNKRKYGQAQWASDRATTIASEPLLTFLSRKAVIPKYGFPVDVVELDTQPTRWGQEGQQEKEVTLQRDLAIAIAEFAPTARLVANKKEWTAYGLKRVAEREWPRRRYMRCPRHHVLVARDVAASESRLAVPCGCSLIPEEYVIPQFGFVAERGKPREPSGRPMRVFSTRPYFMGTEGPEPAPVFLPSGAPVLKVCRAVPGRMAVLCEGRRGQGFYICIKCGAGFRSRERNHDDPFGRSCRGPLAQVALGHEFVTDIVRLQFLEPPVATDDIAERLVWFAHGLASALIEGTAAVLEVPAADLNATVAFDAELPVPPIILYDNAPGGAGLVARLGEAETLRASLEAARQRVVGGCGCDLQASCYGCLRSYRNQFAHRHLKRGEVLQYLEQMLQGW
jgi:hypothetical protein